MARYEIVDPYAKARFKSLWAVVVHATPEDADRVKAYAEAQRAMVADKRWGEYGMVYHTCANGKVLHVGYRFANPNDWYLQDNEFNVEGPFRSKKLILHKLRAKTSKKTEWAGVYRVEIEGVVYHLFTRARAEALAIRQELLP